MVGPPAVRNDNIVAAEFDQIIGLRELRVPAQLQPHQIVIGRFPGNVLLSPVDVITGGFAQRESKCALTACCDAGGEPFWRGLHRDIEHVPADHLAPERKPFPLVDGVG